MKATRYGGAERAWEVRAELPILMSVSIGFTFVMDWLRYVLLYDGWQEDWHGTECYIAAEEHELSHISTSNSQLGIEALTAVIYALGSSNVFLTSFQSNLPRDS